jgi:hypothetical protein
LALGSLWAGIAPAGAVDWQILYRLSETLRVSDNIELRPDPEGAAVSSRTAAGLDIAARTPRAEWSASGDIGHLVSFGKGAPEVRQRTDMAARSNFLRRTRSTDFTLGAYVSQAPLTRRELLDPFLLDPVLIDPGVTDPVFDPGLVDADFELLNFDRISYGFSGGFVHRWTRSDDLVVNARADWVDFSAGAPDLTPHRSVEISGVWTRRLIRRVDGRARASATYFRDESDADIQRLLYNIRVGTNIRATPRLTIDANAGAAIIDQSQSEVGLGLRQHEATVGAGRRQSELSVGFVGDVSLVYTPRRDTTLTFSLSQQVSPDALGDLRTSQAARGGATYRINEWSSFNIIGAFTTSTQTGNGTGSTEVWTISPSYTHVLGREWDLSLSYQWVKTDRAESNIGLLTLSHRGTLLP